MKLVNQDVSELRGQLSIQSYKQQIGEEMWKLTYHYDSHPIKSIRDSLIKQLKNQLKKCSQLHEQ